MQASKRKYISGKLRKLIWEKHKSICQICGCKTRLFRNSGTFFSDSKPCAIDHIKPFSKGGECTEDNFQLLCETCNSQKGAKYND